MFKKQNQYSILFVDMHGKIRLFQFLVICSEVSMATTSTNKNYQNLILSSAIR